jgi:hypothetical protein
MLGPARLIDASVRFPAGPKLCETHFLARLDCGGSPISAAGSAGGARAFHGAVPRKRLISLEFLS